MVEEKRQVGEHVWEEGTVSRLGETGRRSEERRVGKGGRSRGAPDHLKKKKKLQVGVVTLKKKKKNSQKHYSNLRHTKRLTDIVDRRIKTHNHDITSSQTKEDDKQRPREN